MRRRPQLRHFRYEVRYNPFERTEHRHRWLRCWICGRVGTVVDILDGAGGLAVRFCTECLHGMEKGVRESVLESVREEVKRRGLSV